MRAEGRSPRRSRWLSLRSTSAAIWIAIQRPLRREAASIPSPPEAFSFWSFISYSHADDGWAKWLHRALERYRLPKGLVGRPIPGGSVPRRLHPIFRDRDELPGSSSLKSEIEHALARSHSLIVVCSPNAAVSRYVNEEVIAFKRLGREASIHCLLVAGEPNATDNPEKGLLEAFPPAIRFQLDPDGRLADLRADPIAADVRKGKDARTNAKLKLIAGILGVSFDDLRRRDARRQFHQRMQLTGVLLAVLLAIGGVWFNRQQALESKRQIALAQRLADQAKELLDTEHAYMIERGVLLTLEALTRLNRPAVDFAEDGEAAQARLTADQNVRRALSLFYTHVISPKSNVGDPVWPSLNAGALAFSNDGQILTAATAWGSDHNAAVWRWRMDAGSEHQRLKKFTRGGSWLWPTVSDLLNRSFFALSPDGEYLVTTATLDWTQQPNSASVIRLDENREVGRFEYRGRIAALALGKEGEHLAIVSGGEAPGEGLKVQIWHVPSGRAIGGVPDDAHIAGCTQNRDLSRPRPCPSSVEFSPDGRLLAVAGQTITVWELPTPSVEPNVRPGPDLKFYRGEGVAFSPDGRYLAAAGREATVWRSPGAIPVEFGALSIQVWELEKGTTVATVSPARSINGLALSNAGKYLAVVDDRHSLVLHNLLSGIETRVHYSHPEEGGNSDVPRSPFVNLSGKGPPSRGDLAAVAFSRESDRLAMAGEVDPVIWRISGFDEEAVLTPEAKVKSAAFDAAERLITTLSQASDARVLTVQTWELESGRELPERRRTEVADAFVLTPVGDLALAKDDERGSGRGGSVIVHGNDQGSPFRYDGDVRKLISSPDGQLLAVASSLGKSLGTPVSPGRHEVAVWHLGTRSRVLRFEYATAERDASSVRAIAFEGDQWYLDVADGRTRRDGGVGTELVRWEMKSGRKIEGQSDIMLLLRNNPVAASADGRLHAEERGDVIHVSTSSHGRTIARIPVAVADRDPHRLSQRVVALGPHGRYVAAITAERTVRIWPVELSRLILLTCARLTRPLSADEWNRYLATEDPRPTCGG